MRIRQKNKKVTRKSAIALVLALVMLSSLLTMGAAFAEYNTYEMPTEQVPVGNHDDLATNTSGDESTYIHVELPAIELPNVELPENEEHGSQYEQSNYNDDGSKHGEYETEEPCECECEYDCDYYDCTCECGCGYEYGIIEIMPLSMVTVSTQSELLDAIQTAPTDGTVREIILGASFDLDANFSQWMGVSRNIILDGSGHTLTRISDNRHFSLQQGTTLTLRNIILTSQIDTSAGNTRGGIQVGWGHLIMEEGTIIRGNTGGGAGGGVTIGSGTFTMFDGKISENTSLTSSGGVHISISGVFTMYDGEISRNISGTFGGGVSNAGVFTMRGGTINGNRSSNGGGVYNTNIFTMYDGTISGNTAENIGGGVMNSITVTAPVGGELVRAGIFTMNGGVVDGNRSNNGGGVSNFSRFVMNNGVISNNTANINGGGVRHAMTGNFSDVTILSGGTISGNTANGTAVNQGGGGLHWETEACLYYLTIAPNVTFTNNHATAGLRINDDMNREHNLDANGRINPGSWTNSANVPHAFNNHDIRTPGQGATHEYHTVSFNLHGGIGSFPTQSVREGTTVTEPTTTPSRDGYMFAGWYTQPTGGARFNFNIPITANVTIHAQWEPEATQFEPCCTYCCEGYYNCANPCDCECDNVVTTTPPPPTPTPAPTGGGNRQTELPATGIESSVTLWVALLSVTTLVAIGAVVWIRMSKQKTNNE